MKEQLENFLGRWPALYRFVETSYNKLRFRRLKEYFLGTSVREREWATRHLRKSERERNDWGKGAKDWIKGYWDSRDHDHRPFLIERISRFSPNSVLEIGSNCGPNLYLLAKKLPDAEIIGIDINPMAVQKGNEWLAQEGISNVRLLEGKADELGRFQSKSFDVVFSDAVLIYIGPDKIMKVMKQMVRVARRALVLVEWHCFGPEKKDASRLGVYHRGLWRRDYVALLKHFVPEEQIHVAKITEDIWPSKGWKEVGAIIEAILE